MSQRESQIKALVRHSYEDSQVISRYTSIGLWLSEENLLLEYVPDEGRILDMGCGAGRTTIPMAEMGLDVVGIDISAPMVGVARQQAALAGADAEFQVMDSMHLEFPAASFDVALYSYNGIELIPGQDGKKKVMAEVWKVLKPGGYFIFSSHSLFALNRFVPYRVLSFFKLCAGLFAGFPVRERELGERFADGEGEEVRYLQVLPPFLLLKMLRQTGFEVVYFNTRKRLEKGSQWGFPGQFEDGERFYVARKS